LVIVHQTGDVSVVQSGNGTKMTARVGRRVLLVDDHPDTVDVMSVLFRMLGHETRAVLHGRETLRVARAFDPDLVLLDIGLPDLSGYEVVRALRAAASNRRRHIVAATGWGRDQDRERAYRTGFDQHVTKPIDLAKIRHILAVADARAPCGD